MPKKTLKEISVILNDIRSAHNVGSIFRTSDAAGVDKIWLVGLTPAPTDKFARPNKDIAKTALGAEKTLSWEKVINISRLIAKLKSDGFYIVAVEQSKDSTDCKKVKPDRDKVAFVLGNEVDGLDSKILAKCDITAEIPMRGKKESLNVAVSAGIALYSILKI